MSEEILRELGDEISSLKPDPLRVVKCSSDHVELAWENVADVANVQFDIFYKLQMKKLNNEWINVYCGNKPSVIINNLNPKSLQYLKYKIVVSYQTQEDVRSSIYKPINEPSTLTLQTIIPLNTVKDKKENKKTSSLALSIDSFIKLKPSNRLLHKSGVKFQYFPEETFKYKLMSDTPNSVREDLHKNYSKMPKDGLNLEEQFFSTSNSSSRRESLSKECVTLSRIETQWSDVLTVCTGSEAPSIINLFLAVHGGFLNEAESIIKDYPQMLEKFDTEHCTPLMIAIQKGDINMVTLLLKCGANVNTPSPMDRKTAIMISAFHRKLTISQILKKCGANMKARDINGLTPLHYAVESNNLDTLRYFLANGGDIISTDKNGWTPLFTAVLHCCDADIVKMLVDHGSNIDAVDVKGHQPKHYAETNCANESVRKIVDLNYAKNRARFHFRILTKKITESIPNL